MEKSFGLIFFTKKPKADTSQEHYIYLRITVDGIPKELSTKREWDPLKWNSKAGRAEGRTEAAKSINEYLPLAPLKGLRLLINTLNPSCSGSIILVISI